MIVLYVFLGLLALWCYFTFKGRKPKGRQIPGPSGFPLVGNGLDIKPGTMHLTFSDYAEEYGEIVRVQVFKDTLISLNSADFIRKAFNNDPYKRNMNDRPLTFWGNYVLHESQSIGFYPEPFSAGIHGDLRKGVTKALHVYGEGIKEFEERISRELRRLCTVIDGKDGKDFEFVSVVKRSLSNLIAYLLSGEDLSDDDKDVNIFWQLDYVNDYILNAGTNSILLTFPFLVKLPCYYKQVFDDAIDAKTRICRKYFTNIRNTHQPGVIRGVVDFLLDEQAREIDAGGEVVFTDERIQNQIMEIIAAGILTTLSGVTNTILCLVNNPGYQTKVQEELDEVIGPDREPALEDRTNCPFLEAVVMEVTRYIPILPLVLPHFCKTEMEFEGYHVPAGSLIIPNVWYVHHDPAVWGDPWTFRPERWLDESGQLLPTNHPLRKHWLTFGTGRRQCVGEQFARSRLFLYLASLLKTYEFTATPGRCGSCDPRKGAFEISSICRPLPYFCNATRRRVQ